MKNLNRQHNAYEIKDPLLLSSPLIFASPHSGRQYNTSFIEEIALDKHEVRSSEDAYVDKLIDFVPSLGAPLLLAKVPRAVVDFNRATSELDPELIKGINARDLNSRTKAGLGVIPRVVSKGRRIYSDKISLKEAQSRIREYWNPYHEAIKRLLNRAEEAFGFSLLLDIHSMPHEAVAHLNKCHKNAEIVLGDRHGSSANLVFVELIESVFVSHGFSVSRNVPFAGAYITQKYGQPNEGKNAIQIEIDRSLYIKEDILKFSDNYLEIKLRLCNALKEIICAIRDTTSLAAE